VGGVCGSPIRISVGSSVLEATRNSRHKFDLCRELVVTIRYFSVIGDGRPFVADTCFNQTFDSVVSVYNIDCITCLTWKDYGLFV